MPIIIKRKADVAATPETVRVASPSPPRKAPAIAEPRLFRFQFGDTLPDDMTPAETKLALRACEFCKGEYLIPCDGKNAKCMSRKWTAESTATPPPRAVPEPSPRPKSRLIFNKR